MGIPHNAIVIIDELQWRHRRIAIISLAAIVRHCIGSKLLLRPVWDTDSRIDVDRYKGTRPATVLYRDCHYCAVRRQAEHPVFNLEKGTVQTATARVPYPGFLRTFFFCCYNLTILLPVNPPTALHPGPRTLQPPDIIQSHDKQTESSDIMELTLVTQTRPNA